MKKSSMLMKNVMTMEVPPTFIDSMIRSSTGKAGFVCDQASNRINISSKPIAKVNNGTAMMIGQKRGVIQRQIPKPATHPNRVAKTPMIPAHGLERTASFIKAPTVHQSMRAMKVTPTFGSMSLIRKSCSACFWYSAIQ